jgi:diguanylate cyclase (GGDEF)-like protein
LDIDFFKKVNDNYGHQAGDQVLVAVASIIREQLRNNDVLARYGGEEFVALLVNIDEAIAVDIAERIRKKIKALVVETQNKTISVTISIGRTMERIL